MVQRYLKKSGIAAVLNKDPAAVQRYKLPDPDAYSVGKNGKEEPQWLYSTIAQWVDEHSLFVVPETLKPYLREGNTTMQKNLIFPFQEDKLYQLRLYANGYAFQRGSRDLPNDHDFHDDNFGRILCNVYALSPMEAIFDPTEDTPAQRTARVALEYAKAYNAGRAQSGLAPIPPETLITTVPWSMSVAADNKEIQEVVEEIESMLNA